VPGRASGASQTSAILAMVVMLGLRGFRAPAAGDGPSDQAEHNESEHDQGGDTHESSHGERAVSTWIDACREVVSLRCARLVLSASAGGGPVRTEGKPEQA
jgi:hypothetical protein